MKVSVIIPVYNKEKYLHRSIESVLKQTYKNFELILIDDGSTDNSYKIIKSFAHKNNKIKYFYQRNSGVSFTRNRGIKLSKGTFISFLDADDKWHPKFLEKMINSIGNSNVCYTGNYIYDNNRYKKKYIDFKRGDILTNYLYNKTTPHTNSWLIKKEYLLKYNIFFTETISWGEDMTFFIKVLLNNTDVKYNSDYLTYYYSDSYGNLSFNTLEKVDQDINWLLDIKEEILKSAVDSNRKISAIKAIDSYRLPGTIIYRLLNNFDNKSKENILDKYEMYNKYLKKIELNNGLRSVKLICSLLILYLKLNIT